MPDAGADHATRALVAGAVFAACAEACAAVASIDLHHGLWIVAVGWFSVAGLLAGGALPAALIAGYFADRPEARRMARALRRGLGGDDPVHGSLAVGVCALTTACALARAAILTRRWFAVFGANVASTGGVLATVALLALAFVLGSMIAEALFRVVARGLTAGVASRLEAIAVAAALLVTIHTLAPDDLTTALDAAVLGAGAALVPRVHRSVARGVKSPRTRRVAVAWCLAAPFAVVALPNETQLALLHHAPFASVVMGTVQAVHARVSDTSERPREARDRPAAPPAAPPSASRGARERPLDIVLVHLDALRPDHLGFAGYPRPTSPSIDRFRASSTWFERAYTPQPGTLMTLASIFTGREPDDVPYRRGPGPDVTVVGEEPTVVERLASAGYDSVGLTIPYVLEHLHGTTRGFRVWSAPFGASENAEPTTDAALAWLGSLGRRPYFLYVHYECAHGPYVEHASFDFGGSMRDRYDGAVAYCDSEVGRLLDALEPMREHTAVIVYSDHGELLGEHGYTAHGSTLLEPDVRVLLLARIPGLLRSTVRTPVSLVDLGPTLLALAGAPPDTSVDARDLVRVARGPEDERRPVFLYRSGQRGPFRIEARGVVADGLKYVRTDPDVEELYRLDVDRAELTNLLSSRFSEPRADVQSMRARLAALLDAHDGRRAPRP